MKWRISGVVVEADRVVVPSPPLPPSLLSELTLASQSLRKSTDR